MLFFFSFCRVILKRCHKGAAPALSPTRGPGGHCSPVIWGGRAGGACSCAASPALEGGADSSDPREEKLFPDALFLSHLPRATSNPSFPHGLVCRKEANKFLRVREPHRRGLSERKQSCFAGHLSRCFHLSLWEDIIPHGNPLTDEHISGHRNRRFLGLGARSRARSAPRKAVAPLVASLTVS